LSRVQVEHLRPHRAEAFVAFNDGTEATAARGPILDGLQLASRNGAMIDAELADYGNGWMVERLLPTSEQWRPLNVTNAAMRTLLPLKARRGVSVIPYQTECSTHLTTD
jgi:hypothetical protein